MLAHIQGEQPVKWTAVDIATDADLVGLYGIRIPVVKKPGSNTELGWPFDYSMLKEYLQAGVGNS